MLYREGLRAEAEEPENEKEDRCPATVIRKVKRKPTKIHKMTYEDKIRLARKRIQQKADP